ncbi:MAG: DUF4783 domain-containing protein [Cyclobacteriaceae bacterium]
MKYILVSLCLFFGQGEDATISEIGTALKSGSSRELIKYCNETVEIKIDGQSSNYSQAQAEVVLRNFFTKNPSKNFTYIHQGSSPEGLKYNIGRYAHDKGTYRVVMFIKKIGDNYLIDTLNFSQE